VSSNGRCLRGLFTRRVCGIARQCDFKLDFDSGFWRSGWWNLPLRVVAFGN